MDDSRQTRRSAIFSHPFTGELIHQKARKLCRKPGFSRSDEEDLRQKMTLYLWTKAWLFNAERGSVEAFVTMALASWVKMEFRRRRAKKRREGYGAVSLEGTLIEHDGETVSLGAVLDERDLQRRSQRSVRSAAEMVDLSDEAGRVLAALTPSERVLVALVIERGVSGAARQRGVSRRQIQNALSRMRSRFENPDLGRPAART